MQALDIEYLGNNDDLSIALFPHMQSDVASILLTALDRSQKISRMQLDMHCDATWPSDCLLETLRVVGGNASSTVSSKTKAAVSDNIAMYGSTRSSPFYS